MCCPCMSFLVSFISHQYYNMTRMYGYYAMVWYRNTMLIIIYWECQKNNGMMQNANPCNISKLDILVKKCIWGFKK